MLQPLIFLISGLIALWFGSDIIVGAAQRIARKIGVSELIIGLTITSIGTSLPEISNSIRSALNNLQGIESSGIIVGNIIGGNLVQITLILGIVTMVAVLHTTKLSLMRDGSMVLIAASIMYLFSLDGTVSRIEGFILISIYIGYLFYVLRVEKIVEKVKLRKENPVLDFFIIAVGLVVIIYGTKLVVENGVTLANHFNIAEVFIGVFIGIGTSLPELSVSIKAAMRQAHRLSLGNLLGSNITDPLLSFGVGAAISGFSIEKIAILFYFPFWIIVTLIALLMLFNHMNLNKKEGTVLILLYILFIYLSFILL